MTSFVIKKLPYELSSHAGLAFFGKYHLHKIGLVKLARADIDRNAQMCLVGGGSPRHQLLQAVRRIQRPIGRISLDSLAAGMKSSGATKPRPGCCQRTSASTPSNRPCTST